MKILTNGCSFTANSHYKTWPYLLSTDALKNIAQHSAGNRWICDSTVAELIENNYDMVLIMWSGLSRVDEIVDEDAFNQYQYPYFKSINNFGIHYLHHGIDHRLITLNERELVFQSLMNILKLQSFLKSENIDYRFMSYMNYWDIPQKYGFNLITDQFDFSNWIFSDADRNGLYELSQATKQYVEDKQHPNELAHQSWADIIKKEINA